MFYTMLKGIVWIVLEISLLAFGIKGFSVTITRGFQDSTASNVLQDSAESLICQNNGLCFCSGSPRNTYIFDSASLTGKCVRDDEVVKDRSEGKFLPQNDKCVGIRRGNAVVQRDCKADDLSVKWIWTLNEQLLNLKTLKCFKGTSRIVNITRNGRRVPLRIYNLLLEQCNMTNINQKWECSQNQRFMRNKGAERLVLRWIVQGNASYFQSCSENVYSYRGCYPFLDGNFMKLIGSEGCDIQYNGSCGLEIQVQAPIETEYTSCKVDWTTSSYTISGFVWHSFNTSIQEVQLSTSINPVTLQITNKSSLLTKWEGHLLRLNIECRDEKRVERSESHCVLLKIQGTATEQIPVAVNPAQTLYPPSTISSTTFTTTPQPDITSTKPTTSDNNTKTTSSLNRYSTATSFPNVNSEDREDANESPIMLPMVISAVALFCLLLAVVVVIVYIRRKKKIDIGHQNENHIYEEAGPGNNGPVSPIYMEVDSVVPRSKSKKMNSKTEPNQETGQDPFYHTLEKPDRITSENYAEDNGIYEELDKVAKQPIPSPWVVDFEKELNV